MEINAFHSLFVDIADSLASGIHGAMEAAATLIEREAKDSIGHYQRATSFFVSLEGTDSWRPLAASTLDDKQREGYSPPDNPLLRVGLLRESIQHEAAPFEAIVGSNDPVAVYQELGTKSGPRGHSSLALTGGPQASSTYYVPPRSFLGSAAVRKAPEVEALIWGAFEARLTVRTW